MIINIKKKSILTISLLSVFTFFNVVGCGTKLADEKKINTSDMKSDEVHEGEEEESGVVSLTAAQMQQIGLTVGNIEHKQLDAVIKANGVLRVPNDGKGNAVSLFGGLIRALPVQVGDYVNKGEVIATLENTQLVQLQEEYLTIQSRILLAEQEEKRQRNLNEGQAGVKKNLQAATSDLNILQARKASLIAQLALSGISTSAISQGNIRSSFTVKSPISGTVSNVFGKIGAYVDASTPIAEVINNSNLHLDLQVFEKDLPKMKVGQTVHFNLTNNPDTEYDAKVFSVGSSFENDSKTIAVHAKVLGNPKGLIDGMNITAMVSLDNVTTAAVPSMAIIEADGKYFVFLQDSKEKDHFERVEVVKGVSSMGYSGITPVKEILPDARVVTKGAFFLHAKLTNSGGHNH